MFFTTTFCYQSVKVRIYCVISNFQHKNNYFCYCYQSLQAWLPTGWICDRDIAVETCILTLCSNKILQTETLHYMQWWPSKPDVEFYTLYNGLWAHSLQWLCCDFCNFHTKFTVFFLLFFCCDFLLSLLIVATYNFYNVNS